MVETLISSNEFEQNRHIEREKKYLPVFPDTLSRFREDAYPIEQVYLSHPTESFSLRLRETVTTDGMVRHSAALKDRGIITADGLERLEVEVDLSQETYEFYKSLETPVMKKLRSDVNNNVAIDFYEDGHIQVESEHPIAWAQFTDQNGSGFVEVTGDKTADNEWRSHFYFRQENRGQEALVPEPDLNVDRCINSILKTLTRQQNVVVQISGRSGSGKSTIVRSMQERLSEQGVKSMVISTDDYHRGATWLRSYNNDQDWTEWDHPIVYDTEEMAGDILELLRGSSILKREIDFTVVEPIYGDQVEVAPVIIIEGIYATSHDFDRFGALRFDIPTPLATSIGRRLLRDMKERPQFADPEVSLKYMLEQAEPMWRKQSA